MPVELIAADYLKENPKERPHVLDPENIDTCRRLFLKWMAERHGIVAYENQMLDSSQLGVKSYMPRMFEPQRPPCNAKNALGTATCGKESRWFRSSDKTPRCHDHKTDGVWGAFPYFEPAPPRNHTQLASTQQEAIDWIRPTTELVSTPVRSAIRIDCTADAPPFLDVLDQIFIWQRGDMMVHLFSEALYDCAYGLLGPTKQPHIPKNRRKGKHG